MCSVMMRDVASSRRKRCKDRSVCAAQWRTGRTRRKNTSIGVGWNEGYEMHGIQHSRMSLDCGMIDKEPLLEPMTLSWWSLTRHLTHCSATDHRLLLLYCRSDGGLTLIPYSF